MNQEKHGWMHVPEGNTDLMCLPEVTRLEILKREKKRAFMIGNSVPFEVMLGKILEATRFSTLDLAKTVGISAALIDLLLQLKDYKKYPLYPYELLIKSYKTELLLLMQALNFSIQDWELVPDRKHYYDPPVAICIEEEDCAMGDDDDEEEAKDLSEPSKQEFLTSLRAGDGRVTIFNLLNNLNCR